MFFRLNSNPPAAFSDVVPINGGASAGGGVPFIGYDDPEERGIYTDGKSNSACSTREGLITLEGVEVGPSPV